jgi:N-acetylated-alpha-linked acidic dipeptidase
LAARGAVYINTDGNGRGLLEVEGSHTLEKLVNDVARDVEDPEAKIPVWNRLRFARLEAEHKGSSSDSEQENVRTEKDLRIGALGSGSDYTAFLDHLGMASLNIGFEGEDHGGIYHSIYDDFYWYTHFSDTTFVYGRALAQIAGTTTMRLADAELLPFDFGNFTTTVARYIREVETLAKEKRDQIVEQNQGIDDGMYAAVSDPRYPTLPPPREAVPPILNFAPLENGLAALERTAALYDKALAHADENGAASLARASLREVNAKLIAIERALTLNDGLPNRPWFRHQIYAPGFYTGYGVKTLPAVRESIEQKQWKQADEQIARVGKVLENTGEAIEGAAAALQRVR